MSTVIGSRKTKLFIGAGVTDVTSQVSNVRLLAGKSDSEFMSYTEANAGGARQYKLALTLRQDTAAASFWYYIWSLLGTDVAYEFWPNGQNTVSPTTPTALYPKFSGNVTIMEPDGTLLGGEAKADAQSVMITECEWVCTAKPTRAVA